MKYLAALAVFVLLAGFAPPQPGNVQYLPLMTQNHEPGLMAQPVWYVSAEPMLGGLLVIGSMPASCSALRYEIVEGPVTEVRLWSVRPGVECFDTLTPFALQTGLTCARYSVRGQTVTCAHNPYP